MKTLTVKDVIEKLQKLPPNMEVWRCWDESGECWPLTESAFLKTELCDSYLSPVFIAQRKILGKTIYKEVYKEVNKKYKNKKKVLII